MMMSGGWYGVCRRGGGYERDGEWGGVIGIFTRGNWGGV